MLFVFFLKIKGLYKCNIIWCRSFRVHSWFLFVIFLVHDNDLQVYYLIQWYISVYDWVKKKNLDIEKKTLNSLCMNFFILIIVYVLISNINLKNVNKSYEETSFSWIINLNWVVSLSSIFVRKSCVCCQAKFPFPPDNETCKVSDFDPLSSSLFKVIP